MKKIPIAPSSFTLFSNGSSSLHFQEIQPHLENRISSQHLLSITASLLRRSLIISSLLLHYFTITNASPPFSTRKTCDESNSIPSRTSFLVAPNIRVIGMSSEEGRESHTKHQSQHLLSFAILQNSDPNYQFLKKEVNQKRFLKHILISLHSQKEWISRLCNLWCFRNRWYKNYKTQWWSYISPYH